MDGSQLCFVSYSRDLNVWIDLIIDQISVCWRQKILENMMMSTQNWYIEHNQSKLTEQGFCKICWINRSPSYKASSPRPSMTSKHIRIIQMLQKLSPIELTALRAIGLTAFPDTPPYVVLFSTPTLGHALASLFTVIIPDTVFMAVTPSAPPGRVNYHNCSGCSFSTHTWRMLHSTTFCHLWQRVEHKNRWSQIVLNELGKALTGILGFRMGRDKTQAPETQR